MSCCAIFHQGYKTVNAQKLLAVPTAIWACCCYWSVNVVRIPGRGRDSDGVARDSDAGLPTIVEMLRSQQVIDSCELDWWYHSSKAYNCSTYGWLRLIADISDEGFHSMPPHILFLLFQRSHVSTHRLPVKPHYFYNYCFQVSLAVSFVAYYLLTLFFF